MSSPLSERERQTSYVMCEKQSQRTVWNILLEMYRVQERRLTSHCPVLPFLFGAQRCLWDTKHVNRECLQTRPSPFLPYLPGHREYQGPKEPIHSVFLFISYYFSCAYLWGMVWWLGMRVWCVMSRVLGRMAFWCRFKDSFRLCRRLCKAGHGGIFIKWRLISTEIISASLSFPMGEREFTSSLHLHFSSPGQLLRKRKETQFMISSLRFLF